VVLLLLLLLLPLLLVLLLLLLLRRRRLLLLLLVALGVVLLLLQVEALVACLLQLQQRPLHWQAELRSMQQPLGQPMPGTGGGRQRQ
jgi:hypothetical protein